jgi:phosphoribosylformylglycinamidine synthase
MQELAAEERIPMTRLGAVTASGPEAALAVANQFTLGLSDIRGAWEAPIPAALQAPAAEAHRIHPQ